MKPVKMKNGSSDVLSTPMQLQMYILSALYKIMYNHNLLLSHTRISGLDDVGTQLLVTSWCCLESAEGVVKARV